MPNISSVKAVINGIEHELTLNTTSGKWEATLTAPSTTSYTQSGHYYSVAVTATDSAGNSTSADATHATLGTSLRLRVKEITKPVVTITSPSAGATVTNNKPSITVKVTDSGSGVDTSTFNLVIDSSAAVGWDAGTATAITNGYQWTYTPATALSDGSHTIKAAVTDHDGNAATQATSTVKVDTTPPTLNITAPANGAWFNTTSVVVTGVTNDAISSPVTVKIAVGSTDQGAVTVASDGKFTKTVTCAQGANTIKITATDAAGKASTVTRAVNVNTIAPKITAVTLVPNPVDTGKTYTITVTVE